MSAEENRRNYEARLLRVLEYIYQHIGDDLSLDEVASVAAMSRFHWHRVFHAMTGETLADAVRRVRLLRAANALVLEEVPIADIAARHGYDNLASFTRAFTAAHGLPPAAFRARGIEIVNELRTDTGGKSAYPVTIEELAPMHAAGVLHRGPYADIGRAFHRLGATLAARKLFAVVRELFVTYHDAPGSKPEADMRAHVAVVIVDGFPPDLEGLDYFDLQGGKHAVLAHKGPYATLAGAYAWFYGQWLPQSGEEPRDAPPVEVYVNDPRKTAPDDLRTDIRLPLV